MSDLEKFYLEPNGDFLMVFGPGSESCYREIRAACFAGLPSSVCTCQAHIAYLADCTEIEPTAVPQLWKEQF